MIKRSGISIPLLFLSCGPSERGDKAPHGFYES